MSGTPTGYPLAWPPGWKRTTRDDRKSAQFNKGGKQLSIADGCKRVLLELQRLGADDNDVVISTNVELRLDGLPRSDRGGPGDVGVCVYWRTGKTPMTCMAVDRYDTVADNLAAVAATLEYMRGIERHGGAAVLERAFTGFTALPAPIVASMKRDWQVVLGLQDLLLPKEDDVRRAYQRLASLYHPDRGGDAAKMAELNAARDEALKELS